MLNPKCHHANGHYLIPVNLLDSPAKCYGAKLKVYFGNDNH